MALIINHTNKKTKMIEGGNAQKSQRLQVLENYS